MSVTPDLSKIKSTKSKIEERIKELEEEMERLKLRIWDLEHNRFINNNNLIHAVKELQEKMEYLLPTEED